MPWNKTRTDPVMPRPASDPLYGKAPYTQLGLKRALDRADLLQQIALQPRNVDHWAQGLAQLVQAFAARKARKRSEEMERGLSEARLSALDAYAKTRDPYALLSSSDESLQQLGLQLHAKANEQDTDIEWVIDPETGKSRAVTKSEALRGGYQKYSAPSTSINISNSAEREQEKARGKAIGELQGNSVTKWKESAESAISSNQALETMRQSVKNGLQTGVLSPAKDVIAELLHEVGVPHDVINDLYNTTDAARFNAASRQMVMAAIKKLGTNPSNMDLVFIQKTFPQITKNPHAALAVIDWLQAKNQLDIQKFQEGYKNYMSGGDPVLFELEWSQKYGGDFSGLRATDDINSIPEGQTFYDSQDRKWKVRRGNTIMELR